jgi:NET1-associated nuclear protein 1 (U3 small nucleolar RNA-associated protein 17)
VVDPTSPGTELSDVIAAPLAVHSTTSTLILPSSHPSSLQAYSPSTSKLVLELEVSPSNRVSRTDDAPILPLRVLMCAVSSDGTWMMTIDARDGDESSRVEIYLKFWYWDPHAASWVLNTRIDRPHGPRTVTSLTFKSAAAGSVPVAATTGEDGTIKLWRLRSAKGSVAEDGENQARACSLSLRLLILSKITGLPCQP